MDDPHVARHTRSAADDPGAAGKDRSNAVGGDDPADSSPAHLESSLYTERAAAYRAAVDAAYEQDAADLDNLQVPDGKPSAAPTIGTAVDDVKTGARGPASGREFNPEAAGGPIQQLDAEKARITTEGVHEAAAHLQRFAAGGPLETPEQAILDRLTSIAAGDMEPTSYDLNFYTHELDEAARYAQLGFGPESGVDLGSPPMYDVWNDVHTAALEDYRISGADLFHPGLAP
jgi:hypothetical protein